MIALKRRIAAFKQLASWLIEEDYSLNDNLIKLENIVATAHVSNPWFTQRNVRQALTAIGNSILQGKFEKWIEPYTDQLLTSKNQKTIAVINAGNIPAVGFHDFLCVLMAGHHYLGKLSSDDREILPELASLLINIEPGFGEQITFTSEQIKTFDAVIATGSNNTSRYFDYYFGKYPNIIRKNRNGIAILNGNESREELCALGSDIFSYFGMGCRNVSKLYIPEYYKFDALFESLKVYEPVLDVYKYKNNYDYYKSIYLVNGIQHYDNGFVLATQNESISSPPSVLYYEVYSDLASLAAKIATVKDQIQCVVGSINDLTDVYFGDAQKPELWDYADGVDTLKFLISL